MWRVVLVCVIVACLCVSFHVFVGVVCDLLCGDVWFGFVCCVCLCLFPVLKCALFVIDCVMVYVLV